MTDEPNKPVADILRDNMERLARLEDLIYTIEKDVVLICEQTNRLVKMDEKLETVRAEVVFLKTTIASIHAMIERGDYQEGCALDSLFAVLRTKNEG